MACLWQTITPNIFLGCKGVLMFVSTHRMFLCSYSFLDIRFGFNLTLFTAGPAVRGSPWRGQYGMCMAKNDTQHIVNGS